MTLPGVRIQTPTREAWQAIWSGCDYATFFQGPDWAELWRRFSGGKIQSVPEQITFADGRSAILPLCFESKLQGLLSRYVASPQGTFGGWIASEPLDLAQAGWLLDHLLDNRTASVVWRMNPYDSQAFEVGMRRGITCRKDETHALRLDAGANALLDRFKNGYRSDIRKATKHGRISVDIATTLDEWRAYYRVYLETLGRWGHRPDEGYSWKLFETLAGLESPHVKLWLGRYDGAIVSGELCLYAKRHVVSWHAATLKDYLRSHVAKVQIFRVIEDACRSGHAWFDFNPSAGLGGVKVFKESFNAEPLPAPVVYVDSAIKRIVRRVATSLSVPYAQLSLIPLVEALGGAEAPRGGNAPRVLQPSTKGSFKAETSAE